MLTINAAQMSPAGRVEWVDFAKGICIILVVLLHANHGVEKAFAAASLFHDFVAWARPFRMPDFFLIAGLFLSRRIEKPWRSYADTKVLHFAYFYLLWMSVWYVLKLPEYIHMWGLENALLLWPESLIQPLGTLWFIYMLAVFFVVAKLVKDVPVWLIWGGAAVLHGLHVDTGLRVIDEFAARFVFFYSGFVFAPMVFAVADYFSRQSKAFVINALVIWAVVNGWMVFGGWSQLPVIELVLGFVGIGGVVCFGVLLSRVGAGRLIGYCGQNSLPIFLSYFVFMAGLRMVILKSGFDITPDLLVVVTTAAGVIGPLVLFKMSKGTFFQSIYKRPERFKLAQNKSSQPEFRQKLTNDRQLNRNTDRQQIKGA